MKELKQTFCVFILSIVIPGIQNTKFFYYAEFCKLNVNPLYKNSTFGRKKVTRRLTNKSWELNLRYTDRNSVTSAHLWAPKVLTFRASLDSLAIR